MTRICCISDLHGNLPQLPEHDLLIVAGDLTPCYDRLADMSQGLWLRERFLPWLDTYASEKVVIWGNHDTVAERKPHFIPKELDKYILTDAEKTVCGFRIWGSPWQIVFCNWAFQLDEIGLAEKYSEVPDGIDILVTHGPPHGYGDKNSGGFHCGSRSLTERIRKIKPRLVVTGHIHEARGIYQFGDAKVVNASLINEWGLPTNKPYLLEMQ